MTVNHVETNLLCIYLNFCKLRRVLVSNDSLPPAVNDHHLPSLLLDTGRLTAPLSGSRAAILR